MFFMASPGVRVVMVILLLLILQVLQLIPFFGALVPPLISPTLTENMLYFARVALKDHAIETSHLFVGLADEHY